MTSIRSRAMDGDSTVASIRATGKARWPSPSPPRLLPRLGGLTMVRGLSLASQGPHPRGIMPSLLDRLKRRKLGQWGLAYVAGALAAVGLMDAVADPVSLSVTFQQNVLIVLLFGLPLTLVVAAYHGEKGRQRVSGPEILIIGAILVGAGVSLALFPSSADTAVDAGGERDGMLVAVVPFDYVGASPEGESFADAMTFELSVRLGRIDGIQVRSPRSMARFKGSELDVTEIAAAIGANHVLEGVVQEIDGQARVTVQLTEAASGFGEWSDAFDGAASNLFSLTEEMAVRVAEALGLHLSETESEAVRAQYTETAEAWSAFYQGWAFIESAHANGNYSEAMLSRAEQYFDRALDLDSLYAPALAGMSLTHAYHYNAGIDPSPERQAMAEEFALKAIEIDYRLPEAHIALGSARANARDHLAAAAQYEEALRLDDDNAMAWCLLAWVCNRQDPQDAVRAENAARQALARDPTWFLSHHQLGWALQSQGRYEEAEAVLKDGVALNSEYRAAHNVLGQVQLSLGKYNEALATLEKANSLSESSTALVNVGAAQASMGRLEDALESVERALARGFRNFDAIEGSPYFQALRDDPRLEALLDRYREANRFEGGSGVAIGEPHT